MSRAAGCAPAHGPTCSDLCPPVVTWGHPAARATCPIGVSWATHGGTVTFTGLGTRTRTSLGTLPCRPQSRSRRPRLVALTAGVAACAGMPPVQLPQGRFTLQTAPVSPASETSQAAPHPHGGPVPTGPPSPRPVRITSGPGPAGWGWAVRGRGRCAPFSRGTRVPWWRHPRPAAAQDWVAGKGSCASLRRSYREGQLARTDRPALAAQRVGRQHLRSSRAHVGLADSETSPRCRQPPPSPSNPGSTSSPDSEVCSAGVPPCRAPGDPGDPASQLPSCRWTPALPLPSRAPLGSHEPSPSLGPRAGEGAASQSHVGRLFSPFQMQSQACRGAAPCALQVRVA